MRDTCPVCHSELGAPQPQVVNRTPRHGDFGFCGSCGTVLHYVRNPLFPLRLMLVAWPRGKPLPDDVKPGIERALAQAQRDLVLQDEKRIMKKLSPRERALMILGRSR